MRQPTSRPGRPYPTHTRLGRAMSHLRFTVSDVSQETGIYPRTMTEYLAGRKEPTPDHQLRLSGMLGVPVEKLWPQEQDSSASR